MANAALPADRIGSAVADGSTRVVYAALAGNVLVAISKYVAAALSGSSAMLTEAIHSSADCVNQVLLLTGNRRSRAPADESHPFGYGGEIYFWASIVAVMVLFAGGGVSLWEGVQQLRHPTPIRAPALSMAVLALAATFEGSSLVVGYREAKRIIARHPAPGERIGLWRFIKLSKDPNLYESLLEDMAALTGIAIAAVGIAGSAWMGLLWADGAASIGIGVLLVGTSWVIAGATRRLVAGEPVAFPLRDALQRVLVSEAGTLACSDLRTLHLGPRLVLVFLTVQPPADEEVGRLAADLDALTVRLRAVDERISEVFVKLVAHRGP